MQRPEQFAFGTTLVCLSCLCTGCIVAGDDDGVESRVDTLNAFNVCLDNLKGGDVATSDYGCQLYSREARQVLMIGCLPSCDCFHWCVPSFHCGTFKGQVF